MKKDNRYFKQVQWLVRLLPTVMAEKHFALKGGTAINLFVRNMPRLSVDIDLTYLPLEDRETTLKSIRNSLKKIEKELKTKFSEIRMEQESSPEAGKLYIRTPGGEIVVEVNLLLRGSVYPPRMLDLCSMAEEQLEASCRVQTLAAEDLYGGKICAALARQHPRDLFDIHVLFENEGLTESIRKSFLVYLISHNRPMHEVLHPHLKELKDEFIQTFQGMTDVEVKLETLEAARNRLIKTIRSDLSSKERDFLLSFKNATPQWDLLEINNIQNLPGVQWKLMNIKKMNSAKRADQHQLLKQVLEL